MSGPTENGKEYVNLAILRPTHALIAMECPKAWTYDRFMNELIEMWKNYKKSGAKSGKSTQSDS